MVIKQLIVLFLPSFHRDSRDDLIFFFVEEHFFILPLGILRYSAFSNGLECKPTTNMCLMSVL